jgi:prepilin-type N-terminal cleavage/methylation domain-containing protein
MLSRRRPHGFTLVEALAALALMLVGLAGAGLALARSLQHERESGNRRAALRLAASLADELRALDRDAFESLEPDAPALAAWVADVTAALPAGSAAHVEPDGGTPPGYLIRIEWPVAGAGLQRLVLPVTT